MMMSPWHRHVCVPLQLAVKKCTLKTESPEHKKNKTFKLIINNVCVSLCVSVRDSLSGGCQRTAFK